MLKRYRKSHMKLRHIDPVLSLQNAVTFGFFLVLPWNYTKRTEFGAKNQFFGFHQDHMRLPFHRSAMWSVKFTLKERVDDKKTIKTKRKLAWVIQNRPSVCHICKRRRKPLWLVSTPSSYASRHAAMWLCGHVSLLVFVPLVSAPVPQYSCCFCYWTYYSAWYWSSSFQRWLWA